MNKMFFILLVLSTALASIVGGIAIQTALLWAAAGGLLLLALAYQHQQQRAQALRRAHILRQQYDR